ncbi:MAG: hypothetical protein SNI45_02760 [Rikenellaceae bacterium]
MKKIISILFLLSIILSLSAQELTIRKSAKAQAALTQIDSLKGASTVSGYRIGIFFDNGQQARTKATEARDHFAINFPSEPVYMVYQSPYYKVSAGNCLTEEEAIILFERIRKIFPNAYVMRETMPISSFIERPAAEVDPQEVDSLLIDSLLNRVFGF